MAVDVGGSTNFVDFVGDLQAAADMDLLVVLDIVVVIFVYSKHLCCYQIRAIRIKRLEFVYLTVDFVLVSDKP